MDRDWTGNSNSVFKCIGGTGHAKGDREIHDYYATDPNALNYLINENIIPHNVWECSCGEGHLSKKLVDNGYNVFSSDLVDRCYGNVHVDFLKTERIPFSNDERMCILTNPPYKFANEFILHGLKLLKEHDKIFMFLKTTFLAGKKRKSILYDYTPPRNIYTNLVAVSYAQRMVISK